MTTQELQSYTPRPDLSEEESLKLQRAISYFESGKGDVIADLAFSFVLKKYTVKGETNDRTNV